MIAVDTNILVRFHIRDDEKQFQLAYSLIKAAEDEDEGIFISNTVIIEFVWVLDSVYSVPKELIIHCLRNIINAGIYMFENPDHLARAIDAYEKGPADLSDYLLCLNARSHSAATTYTFDRKAAKHELFTLLR